MELDELGVLDPTLNVDTLLFIDPMLLEHSRHAEIHTDARQSYEEHFATAIKLLAASSTKDDVAWRNSVRKLSFPEVKGTCLGPQERKAALRQAQGRRIWLAIRINGTAL